MGAKSRSFVMVGSVQGLAPRDLKHALDLLMDALVDSGQVADPAVSARLDGDQVEVEFMFAPAPRTPEEPDQ